MFIILGLSLFLLFILNLQFTPWPEMLLWPYLILHGWLPYKDIAIAHSPLLILVLSTVFRLISVSVLSLKIFSWSLILINSLVLYLVSRRLYPHLNSSLVFLTYIILVFRYEGNGVWFDLSLVMPVILLFYFLNLKKYFLAGVMFGISLAIKQTVFWFSLPAFLFFLNSDFLHNFLQFFKGLLCVVVLWWGTTVLLGIFPFYWYWSIQFGLGVLPGMPGIASVSQLASGLLPYLILLLVLFIKSSRRQFIILASWSLFGLLGIFPRFGLFHFQPSLPFLAIFAVYIYSYLSPKLKLVYFVIIFLFTINSLRYFSLLWQAPDRFMEPRFLAAVEIAKSTPGTMFNYNWWDSAYVLAGKLPPRPWVPQLDWYLHQPNIKSQLITSLQSTLPKTIVYFPGGDDDLNQFIQNNYATSPASCTLGCTITHGSHPSN